MNRCEITPVCSSALWLTLAVLAGCDVAARPTPRPVQTLLDPPAAFPNPQGPNGERLLSPPRASAGEVTQAGYAEAATGSSPAAFPLVPVSPQNDQEAAADALARIGAPAAPSLMAALRNHDPAVRRQAAQVLARMGPEAREAASELTRLLDDPDSSVRLAAAHALGHIGPDAAIAVPALMRNLVQGQPLPPGTAVSAGPAAPLSPAPTEVAPAGFNVEIPMPPAATFGPPAASAPLAEQPASVGVGNAPTGPVPVAPVQPPSFYQP